MDNLLEQLPKAVRIKEEIKSAILKGQYGKPGDRFMSVRALASTVDVSLVTAHRIMGKLKEDGIIEAKGNKSVITAYQKTPQQPKVKVDDKLLGLVVTNIENPFFAALAKEVEECVRHQGYKLVSASTNYSLEREQEIIDMFKGLGVRGILACPGPNPLTVSAYKDLKVPFVFIARKLEGLKTDCVLVNQLVASQMVGEHLVQCGARNYYYLGFQDIKHDPRLQGYKMALDEHGKSLPESNILKTKTMDSDKAEKEVVDFISRIDKPAALFGFHDLLAIQALKASYRLGLKVPEDIAIVGFDNLPVAAQIIPGLTSVSYPLKEMAEMAFERLEKVMNSPEPLRPLTNYLEPALVIRGSSFNIKEEAGNSLETEWATYQIS